MATKDWKKESGVGVVDHLWKNQKNSNEVWVYKIRLSDDKIGWAVTIRNPGGSTAPDKSFKTKSQALKFAKSYMRKH